MSHDKHSASLGSMAERAFSIHPNYAESSYGQT
jgi:hypothetical protein